MIASGKIFILSFIFFCNGYPFSVPDFDKTDIDLKRYIQTDQRAPANFSITVDAKKVNWYIQLSDLRFVIDFKDMKGNLISRDTIDFFPKPSKENGLPGSLNRLSGGNI